ncbi:hypothetical protein HBI73_176930 [Parastagonospora nodorum]|nr:hypothetical protein HBH51_192810 [Parastagonospora nodorum]KAH4114644.1 hypothetical protein HBH47_192670 [Parastagonospora nodorum]KAH4180801.1 hypothetical protein HBH43_009430 [Parastagonospora nodorum]KAH5077101.1 hypothetical protein HBI73_176930 [Parastagonospora nodorum]KAH5208303.1 hypothetical protein HBH68_086200 [Parastagonospora nodorum]
MSLAYKVEELLALRDSVSESAVSIDRFADEDVIKEHVLRPSASASANLASRSSGRSLRVPVAQPLIPTAPQKRPSPTPSIKRGKAEKLLKEHGSPPGMRVTAGGRIVPSDLPPLGTSRFPDNSFKPSTLRVTPNNIMSAQTQSNNNSAARIEVVGGQPVVFIGDRMFALPAVNANSTPAMGSNAIMEPSAKHAPEPPALSTYGSMPGLSYGPSRTNSTSPFAGLDLPTLKSQQSLKKQELRSVEQTEVLQASHQSEAWRANMIEKKRCLIVELDALRKSITALENENGAAAPTNSFIGPAGTAPASASLPTFVPQVQQPVSQALYPFPAASPYTPMMMYPPPYSAFPSFPGSEPTPFVAPSVNPPRSPGSASRRSHAIAIKPPQDGSIKPALNPKSPTYEPATKPGAVQSAVPPTPSPPKRSPWRTQEEPQSRREQRPLSQKLSFSSVDTTDFFPTNTHEHSSTRLAPRAFEPKQIPNDNTAIPSTPEKHWPASPWNEGHSGRVNKNEPISKLTSWPEAFGKRQSSSSLRQSATGQHLACVLEKAPTIGSYGPELASNKKMIARSDSDQRNDTNENWPFSRKAVAHVPSTYQEGYQAGYDHVGMPDSPEVLQGYVQGLLQFLADELKRGRLDGAMRESYAQGTESRTHSLRGLIAGSMPHDSAISMTFNHNTGQSTNYENVGSSKDSLPAKMYQDSSYSAQGGIKDVQNAYALLTEAAYVSRQRNVSSMQYPSPANPIAEGPATRRPATLFSGENEPSKAGQDKGIANRADADASKTNGGFGRQFSGAQIQNRDYGTPFSNQRFYPTPKEMSPNGSGGEAATSMRPFANHRLSGLDGAMDDLADIVLETHIDDQRAPANKRAADGPEVVEAEAEEATASCFKPSGGKGKQKALGSPPKSCGNGRSNGVSSPNPPSSPKKSGELSPAKAKLEQVTNKFRRNRKDDPRTMSPEEKTRRSDKWRKRFQAIKREELEEIEEHRRNTRN